MQVSDLVSRSRETRSLRDQVGLSANENLEFVAVYGDSQLRPVVEGFVSPPTGRLLFGVNSTPGGSLRHVRKEMLANHPPRQPALVVLVAGTNNLHSPTSNQEDMEEFAHLLRSTRAEFPKSKVAAACILPRLDMDVSQYNKQFKDICHREGIDFLDYQQKFPTSQRRLWSRNDSLHLSEDSGLPRLLRQMEESCIQLLQGKKPGAGTTPSRRTTPQCPAEEERTALNLAGYAYVPHAKHAGLYKVQLWKKDITTNPGSSRKHRRCPKKKSKPKRKFYQASKDDQTWAELSTREPPTRETQSNSTTSLEDTSLRVILPTPTDNASTPVASNSATSLEDTRVILPTPTDNTSTPVATDGRKNRVHSTATDTCRQTTMVRTGIDLSVDKQSDPTSTVPNVSDRPGFDIEQNAYPMQLFVSLDKNYCIPFSLSTTCRGLYQSVHDIAARYCTECYCPEILLVYGGKVLDRNSDVPLEVFGIQGGSTVHTIIPLKGGSRRPRPYVNGSRFALRNYTCSVDTFLDVLHCCISNNIRLEESKLGDFMKLVLESFHERQGADSDHHSRNKTWQYLVQNIPSFQPKGTDMAILADVWPLMCNKDNKYEESLFQCSVTRKLGTCEVCSTSSTWQTEKMERRPPIVLVAEPWANRKSLECRIEDNILGLLRRCSTCRGRTRHTPHSYSVENMPDVLIVYNNLFTRPKKDESDIYVQEEINVVGTDYTLVAVVKTAHRHFAAKVKYNGMFYDYDDMAPRLKSANTLSGLLKGIESTSFVATSNDYIEAYAYIKSKTLVPTTLRNELINIDIDVYPPEDNTCKQTITGVRIEKDSVLSELRSVIEENRDLTETSFLFIIKKFGTFFPIQKLAERDRNINDKGIMEHCSTGYKVSVRLGKRTLQSVTYDKKESKNHTIVNEGTRKNTCNVDTNTTTKNAPKTVLIHEEVNKVNEAGTQNNMTSVKAYTDIGLSNSLKTSRVITVRIIGSNLRLPVTVMKGNTIGDVRNLINNPRTGCFLSKFHTKINTVQESVLDAISCCYIIQESNELGIDFSGCRERDDFFQDSCPTLFKWSEPEIAAEEGILKKKRMILWNQQVDIVTGDRHIVKDFNKTCRTGVVHLRVSLIFTRVITIASKVLEHSRQELKYEGYKTKTDSVMKQLSAHTNEMTDAHLQVFIANGCLDKKVHGLTDDDDNEMNEVSKMQKRVENEFKKLVLKQTHAISTIDPALAKFESDSYTKKVADVEDREPIVYETDEHIEQMISRVSEESSCKRVEKRMDGKEIENEENSACYEDVEIGMKQILEVFGNDFCEEGYIDKHCFDNDEKFQLDERDTDEAASIPTSTVPFPNMPKSWYLTLGSQSVKNIARKKEQLKTKVQTYQFQDNVTGEPSIVEVKARDIVSGSLESNVNALKEKLPYCMTDKDKKDIELAIKVGNHILNEFPVLDMKKCREMYKEVKGVEEMKGSNADKDFVESDSEDTLHADKKKKTAELYQTLSKRLNLILIYYRGKGCLLENGKYDLAELISTWKYCEPDIIATVNNHLARKLKTTVPAALKSMSSKHDRDIVKGMLCHSTSKNFVATKLLGIRNQKGLKTAEATYHKVTSEYGELETSCLRVRNDMTNMQQHQLFIRERERKNYEKFIKNKIAPGRGRKLKIESFPELPSVIEKCFGQFTETGTGGGGLEAHPRLSNTTLYKSRDNATTMIQCRELVLACAPPDFKISLQSCYNYTQNYRVNSRRAKDHHHGRGINARVSLHAPPRVGIVKFVVNRHWATANANFQADLAAENPSYNMIDSKDAKKIVTANIANTRSAKTWKHVILPDHDWDQSRTYSVTPMTHLFVETKLVKKTTLEHCLNNIDMPIAKETILHISRTGSAVTLINLSAAEPSTTFRAYNEMFLMMTIPSLDKFFRNPETGKLKSVFTFLVDNGPAEAPASELCQMWDIRLMKFLNLDKVVHKSFPEYYSKRNYVERVHSIENAAMESKVFHCPTDTELYSSQYFKDMEAMAAEVIETFRTAKFGETQLQCFRGVKDSDYVFSDEKELKHFLSLNELKKQCCELEYKPVQNKIFHDLVHIWEADENYTEMYQEDYRVLHNEAGPQRTAWVNKYTTAIYRPDNKWINEDNHERFEREPLPDYVRWLVTDGEVHYMSYEKRKKLEHGEWDETSGLWLPSRILNMIYKSFPNLLSRDEGHLDLFALLAFVSMEEFKNYYEMKNKHMDIVYKQDEKKGAWSNHELYKTFSKKQLQDKCLEAKIQVKGANKAELVELLVKKMPDLYENCNPAGPSFEKLDAVPSTVKSLSKMPMHYLRDVLKSQDQYYGGSRDELITRIVLLKRGQAHLITKFEITCLKKLIRIAKQLLLAQIELYTLDGEFTSTERAFLSNNESKLSSQNPRKSAAGFQLYSKSAISNYCLFEKDPLKSLPNVFDKLEEYIDQSQRSHKHTVSSSCTESEVIEDTEHSRYLSFFQIGATINVKWSKEELGLSGWSVGWYKAEVQNAWEDSDEIEVIYDKEPGCVYTIEVSLWLSQGKLELIDPVFK